MRDDRICKHFPGRKSRRHRKIPAHAAASRRPGYFIHFSAAQRFSAPSPQPPPDLSHVCRRISPGCRRRYTRSAEARCRNIGLGRLPPRAFKRREPRPYLGWIPVCLAASRTPCRCRSRSRPLPALDGRGAATPPQGRNLRKRLTLSSSRSRARTRAISSSPGGGGGFSLSPPGDMHSAHSSRKLTLAIAISGPATRL